MMHDETHNAAQESVVDGPVLPFEYEDRTDGRYARALAEFEAARRWTQRRRAQGLRPN